MLAELPKAAQSPSISQPPKSGSTTVDNFLHRDPVNSTWDGLRLRGTFPLRRIPLESFPWLNPGVAMKRKLLISSLYCTFIALSMICLQASPIAAQVISIGPGGLQLRGRSGERVNINGDGVRVDQGVYPQPQPQNHGVMIQGSGTRVYTQPGYGREPVIVDQKGVQIGRVPRRIAPGGNFIVTNQDAFPYQHAAEAAFKDGNLEYAIQSVKRAIRKDKHNGLLHLFASHLRFSAGDYEKSADELDLATKTLPLSDWDVIIRNVEWLDSKQNYEGQQNRLIGYLNAKPNSDEARLVYGFHVAFTGRKSVAAEQFATVLRAEPDFELAIRLNETLILTSRNRTPIYATPVQPTKSVMIRNGRDDVRIPSNPSGEIIHANPNQLNSVLIKGRRGTISSDGGTVIEYSE